MEPTLLASGTVALVHLAIRADAPPGIVPVRISNITAADAQGARVSLRAIDGFVEVKAAETTPLLISSVGVTRVTATSATIVWSTNLASTSQTDYGVPPSLSSSTAVDTELVFIHTQVLSGLMPNTNYQYRVRSTTPAGASAAVDANIFVTSAPDGSGQTSNRWFFPRISTQGMGLAGEEHLGLALVNQDSSPAALTITALTHDGIPYTRFGFSNPFLRTLQPGQKFLMIDSEIFGAAELPASIGTVKVESPSDKITGFFVMYENALTRLDGAAVSSTPLHYFLIPEIEAAGGTRIHALNPNAIAAALTFSLVSSHGEVRSSAARALPPMGTAVVDIDNNLFGVAVNPTDYVRGTSDTGMMATGLFKGPAADFSVLNGMDASVGSTRLFAPQFVYDANWRSSLTVINLDPLPGWITIDLIDENGVSIGGWGMVMEPNGKIRVEDPASFGVGNFQGYLQIASNGIRLAGSATFGTQTAETALPLVSSLQSATLFSHLASDATYYTGIAILNPGDTEAVGTLVLYNDAGGIDQTAPVRVPARQRISRLLTEYFPSLTGQNRTSGYVRLLIGREVASYAVYGTKNLSILCAIPGQTSR
jgi:hypothetical protein